MPFKSKAQIKRFGEMVKKGDITQEKFNQWMSETPSPKKLPERIGRSPRSIGDLKKIQKSKVIK